MSDMQKRDVVILFPGDEEKGVKELGELWDEVPPTDGRNLKGIGIIGTIDRFTHQAEICFPSVVETLAKHPRAEENLQIAFKL